MQVRAKQILAKLNCRTAVGCGNGIGRPARHLIDGRMQLASRHAVDPLCQVFRQHGLNRLPFITRVDGLEGVRGTGEDSAASGLLEQPAGRTQCGIEIAQPSG